MPLSCLNMFNDFLSLYSGKIQSLYLALESPTGSSPSPTLHSFHLVPSPLTISTLDTFWFFIVSLTFIWIVDLASGCNTFSLEFLLVEFLL